MKIILLKGAPCSGKSTWARQYVDEHTGTEIVNRDSLRLQLNGGEYSFEKEKLVIDTEIETVKSTIRSGKDIIIDDTNLNPKTVSMWENVAKELGVEIDTKEFYVSFEEAMKRSKARKAAGGLYIPRDVMLGFYKRYFPDRLKDEFTDHRTIKETRSGLRPAVICDLDGTIALHTGRDPFDWDKIPTDRVDTRLKNILTHYDYEGVKVLFVSGRPEKTRQTTQQWLNTYVGVEYELFLRDDSDHSHGDDFKRKVYKEKIEDVYNVLCVFEDSNKCVKMYREEGLLTCQVENSDY